MNAIEIAANASMRRINALADPLGYSSSRAAAEHDGERDQSKNTQADHRGDAQETIIHPGRLLDTSQDEQDTRAGEQGAGLERATRRIATAPQDIAGRHDDQWNEHVNEAVEQRQRPLGEIVRAVLRAGGRDRRGLGVVLRRSPP